MNKITLSYPIALAPHPKVTELTMRRPKAKDVLEAERLGGGKDDAVEMHLFALLTGQAFEVLGEIDYETDYPKLQEAYRNFRKARAAGSSASAPGNSGSAASSSASSE